LESSWAAAATGKATPFDFLVIDATNSSYARLETAERSCGGNIYSPTSMMSDSREPQLSDSDLHIVKLPCHTFSKLIHILQRLSDTHSSICGASAFADTIDRYKRSRIPNSSFYNT
jgi:hypothetical protein